MISRSHANAGFTLVELMVSLAISSVMLVMLVGIASRSTEVCRRLTQQTSAISSASSALEMITLDLESLAATSRAEEFLQAVPDPAGPMKGANPMWLMMNVNAPQDSRASTTGSVTTYPDSGLVRAVSYRVAWQDPITGQISASQPESNIFGLYRNAASSSDSFTSALGITDLQNSFWKTRTTTRQEDFVAGNIIDFQIAFYTAASSTPANISGVKYGPVRISGTGATANGTAISGTTVIQAEVSLTVLEDTGARLWADGTGTGGLSPAILRQKYGHTLTRRSYLRLAP